MKHSSNHQTISLICVAAGILALGAIASGAASGGTLDTRQRRYNKEAQLNGTTL
jgi:hypothetical protein